MQNIMFLGCAFHQNTSVPFMAHHQEIIFKGRPSNNIFYLRTVVADNAWGGILVGNFCTPISANIIPKVEFVVILAINISYKEINFY